MHVSKSILIKLFCPQVSAQTRQLLANSSASGSSREQLTSIYLRQRFIQQTLVDMEIVYNESVYNITAGLTANYTRFNVTEAMEELEKVMRTMKFELDRIPSNLEFCFICCCGSAATDINPTCMPKREKPKHCVGGEHDTHKCTTDSECGAGSFCSADHPFMVCFESEDECLHVA
jgi:hypothetical protein